MAINYNNKIMVTDNNNIILYELVIFDKPCVAFISGNNVVNLNEI